MLWSGVNNMAQIYAANEIMPDLKDATEVLTGKLSYDNAKATKDPTAFNMWCNDKKYFYKCTPRGIAYSVSQLSYNKYKVICSTNGWKTPRSYAPKALRYFILAVAIGWDDLVTELKKTLKYWGFTSDDIKQYAEQVWQIPANMASIGDLIEQVQKQNKITLIEAVEKHDRLNPKLFTKDELLKEAVRKKFLDIVDEFLADLKSQNIEIKVDDILLIGSNASYNYNKNSDIDLHIITNTKSTSYSAEVAEALYSAYRSLFNKSLSISIYGIPLEIFVETENAARVSNGAYSVKYNKWEKKPVHEDIPDYDKDALDRIVTKWEQKYKALVKDIKDDKLSDEKRIVKLLTDIYDKLRKKGVAKSEYSIENLAFKELRNAGYLDKLKEYRNELISKRLSLEERLDRKTRIDIYNQIARICGSQPIIQENGLFFVYNLKASDVNAKVRALRNLPFVEETTANESGKYDFSNPMELAMNKIPSKYYNIRGKVSY